MTHAAEKEILELCRKLEQAHHDKDAEAIVACFAPEAVIYDLAPPLGRRGQDRSEVQAWLDTWRGPISIKTAEVDLVVSGDLAYSSALNRIGGTKTEGVDIDLWFRATMCFRRTGAGWRIVHDHTSVPFLMDGSERAALNLRP